MIQSPHVIPKFNAISVKTPMSCVTNFCAGLTCREMGGSTSGQGTASGGETGPLVLVLLVDVPPLGAKFDNYVSKIYKTVPMLDPVIVPLKIIQEKKHNLLLANISMKTGREKKPLMSIRGV